MVRINTDRIDSAAFDWNEAATWDAEAEFYKTAAPPLIIHAGFLRGLN
jgi:hypothetical protein